MSMIAPQKLNAALLDDALARVASSADERDRAVVPPFPEEAIADLEAVGALAWNAQPGSERPPAAAELGLVRSVARADGSIGRLLDGHHHGVERLAVQAPPAHHHVADERHPAHGSSLPAAGPAGRLRAA